MPSLNGRDLPATSSPLGQHATGQWFRRKGRNESMQRYDEAGPGIHWYYGNNGWHAYREVDMVPSRQPKKAKGVER